MSAQDENQGVAKPKKKRQALTTLLVIGIVLAACIVATVVFIETKFSTMNQKIDVGNFSLSAAPEESEDPEEAETPAPTSIPEILSNDVSQIQQIAQSEPSDLYNNPKAINILLFGLDTRNPAQFNGGRTDTIIILTLDTVNKEVKLTSIMRDTLVSIPGHDLNRINTVFEFNGPDAAVDTVEKYFNIKIDYYVIVNFWAVANLIDSVGGVNIDIQPSEIGYLNGYLDEINRYSRDNKTSPHITSSGIQMLDGRQAVAYMRIRYVGDADFERTERQRRVLDAIMKKDFSLSDILSMANNLPNYVRTNIRQLEMISLTNTAFSLKDAPIKQLRLPVDHSYQLSRYKGMSILSVDFEKNADILKEFLEGK